MVLCITIGEIVVANNLLSTEAAVNRLLLGTDTATLIVILAACVVISPVATKPHGRGQIAAIFTLIAAACTFVGFSFDLLLLLADERGAAIGPTGLIFIGLPALVISSMVAWLQGRTETRGESTNSAVPGA
jgi:hypothetical protein